MTMRRLVAWNVMTLDGCFEGTAPWTLEHHQTVWGDELEAFSLQQGREIGTLLFGRRTFEGMRDYWRGETGAVADMMNALPKAVATRTLAEAGWNNTRLLPGEAAGSVRALKAEGGKDVFVFGSADLLATLLAQDLVDEYRICLAPVVLGAGNPLFRPGGQRRDFALAGSQVLGTGGVILSYRRLPRA